MKNKFILFLFPFLALFAACSSKPEPQKKASLLVSIPPYAYIANEIARDTISVHTIVPPGFNPHVFEPKPSEVIEWGPLTAWIRIGEGFEKKISKALQTQNPHLAVLDLSSDATIASQDHHHHHHDHEECCHHEEKDLHFWLSPKIMQNQAKKIFLLLCDQFPEHKDLYQENFLKLERKLQEIDKKIPKILERSPSKTILVSHPAFAYFCKEYNLHQISIEVEGKDPLPHHISHVLEMAKKTQIATVLLQPQYSNKGAEIVAKQLHLQTAEIDPYAYEYLSNLEKLAETISPVKQ